MLWNVGCIVHGGWLALGVDHDWVAWQARGRLMQLGCTAALARCLFACAAHVCTAPAASSHPLCDPIAPSITPQAGALDGPMLHTMAREASTRGLGALYATYGAFMLKSIPFDVAELATYSQMTDWREAAAARAAAGASGGGSGGSSGGGGGWRERVGEALAAMPLSASDMLIGEPLRAVWVCSVGSRNAWCGAAACRLVGGLHRPGSLHNDYLPAGQCALVSCLPYHADAPSAHLFAAHTSYLSPSQGPLRAWPPCLSPCPATSSRRAWTCTPRTALWAARLARSAPSRHSSRRGGSWWRLAAARTRCLWAWRPACCRWALAGLGKDVGMEHPRTCGHCDC